MSDPGTITVSFTQSSLKSTLQKNEGGMLTLISRWGQSSQNVRGKKGVFGLRHQAGLHKRRGLKQNTKKGVAFDLHR